MVTVNTGSQQKIGMPEEKQNGCELQGKNRSGKEGGATVFPLAPVHLAGLGAIQIALAICFIDPLWALAPLAAFFLITLIAPFVQRLQFFLPIVTRGSRGSGAVALTFDDGPDPFTTPQLLNLLADRDIKATFFVIGSRVRKHPHLLRMMLDQGHEIGNHSCSHDVLLMFRGADRLRREVKDCQRVLKSFGIRPVAFRPPVGVTNPRLWRVLLESGMYCAGFRRRARDWGNRRVRGGLAKRVLMPLKPGDVIMLHDCKPLRRGDTSIWLGEIIKLIDGLRQKGLETIPLSQLIQRPVMEPPTTSTATPVQIFFDSVVRDMDGTQNPPRDSPAKRVEQTLFESFEKTIQVEERILEIGAGTGRYTLPMARRAREVVAVDISPRSLEVLRKKAREEKVENIEAVLADVMQFPVPGTFDVICSFSAFEYIQVLQPTLQALVSHLKPGGRLYFITSHRSLFRFFSQIGNAMRQGLWLHARTCSQIVDMLHALGMEDVSVSTHGMKSLINGGLLLEASARKK